MIVLIGGSGFIGNYIASELYKKKINFIILDKKKSKKFKKKTKIVNILNKEKLTNFIPYRSTIINLAAVHQDNDAIKDYYLVNVKGSENICEAALKKKCRSIIFFSTVAIYGKSLPFASEVSPQNPFNHYGISKKRAEKVYIKWNYKHKKNNLKIIRPTAVFGKGNRGNIHNLISQIQNGFFFMVGDGSNIKSLAYVENLSKFTLYLLNYKTKFSVHNYVDGPQISLKELINFIRWQLNIKTSLRYIPYIFAFFCGITFDILSKILNKKFHISRVRVEKFISESSYSANLLRYKPKYSLKDSLKKTILEEFC